MDLRLNGRNIVITGGTRGIGRAIAEHFADENANIALCARNEQQVVETIQALQDKGINAVGAAVDIADHAKLRSWIDHAAEQLGGIDAMIANPSAFGIGATEDDWKSGYAVDLMGTVQAIEAATPYLEKSADSAGDAAVLLISSALVAEADMESAYGAYKAALVHYAKGAARRLAPKGIRVNAISPGTIYVDDGFWGNVQRNMPELYEHYFNRNPMGRMGCPNEVAKAALFLCSPVASFITGENLFVDGAFTNRVNY
ncbi:MAG: SDR family oxidoreductase [Gammaproteobacteria bacterium]|nr:SDR family oxidoreductase [Gammaproteobacteria bacterium]